MAYEDDMSDNEFQGCIYEDEEGSNDKNDDGTSDDGDDGMGSGGGDGGGTNNLYHHPAAPSLSALSSCSSRFTTCVVSL